MAAALAMTTKSFNMPPARTKPGSARENILERWLYRVFPFLRWFRAESE